LRSNRSVIPATAGIPCGASAAAVDRRIRFGEEGRAAAGLDPAISQIGGSSPPMTMNEPLPPRSIVL
jgi:hypothetical protein